MLHLKAVEFNLSRCMHSFTDRNQLPVFIVNDFVSFVLIHSAVLREVCKTFKER